MENYQSNDHNCCNRREKKPKNSGYNWCSAVNCRNNAGQKEKKISFFRFPLDPERCKKWVVASRRADLDKKEVSYLYNNCKLCSDHFEDSMFLNNLRNRLKKDAIPSLFNVPNPPPSFAVKRKPPKDRDFEMYSRSPKRLKLNSFDNGHSDTSCLELEHVSDEQVLVPAIQNSEIQTPESQEDQENDPELQLEKNLEESPRKKRLRCLASKWKSRAIRLKKGANCQKRSEKSNTSDTMSSLPQSVLKFIEMFRQGAKKYNNKTKRFALSLYFLSPRAYDFLRAYLPLPSPRLLQDMTSKIPMSPGINEWVVKVLKMKAESLKPIERNCVICIDEMAIRKNLYYDIHKDQIIGFADTGDTRSTVMASAALVVMVRGIASN